MFNCSWADCNLHKIILPWHLWALYQCLHIFLMSCGSGCHHSSPALKITSPGTEKSSKCVCRNNGVWLIFDSCFYDIFVHQLCEIFCSLLLFYDYTSFLKNMLASFIMSILLFECWWKVNGTIQYKVSQDISTSHYSVILLLSSVRKIDPEL